jgi:amidase
MMTFKSIAVLALASTFLSSCNPAPPPIDDIIVETQFEFTKSWTLSELSDAIQAGDVSSEKAVETYLERIELIDKSGPKLQSILTINPDALKDARALDAELVEGNSRGPLHGIPILLKDNIETKDNMPTTAGALALKDNLNGRDAPLVAKLREAGIVVLGKTNLSQWANFRSTKSLSGWSALGGQTRNPHVLDRSPCGSSAGSGAAMASYLAAATIGTETNGSVICPSSINGIVGFKPTVGLVAQDLIIPIASTQDTAGPMTLTVRDAALMLDGMATGEYQGSFVGALHDNALDGKRIGVLRFAEGDFTEVSVLFQDALDVLEEAGATLIEIDEFDTPDGFWNDSFDVLKFEFKKTLNDYLASTGEGVKTRSLAEVIEFNKTVADVEMPLFDQDILEMSEAKAGLDDAEYLAALAKVLKATREDGLDKFVDDHNLDLVVAPSTGPSFVIDPVYGDTFPGEIGAGWIAAIAGYPHVSVPMGEVRALPVGLSFMGLAGDDANILAAGHAYEIRSNLRITPKFLTTAEDDERVFKAFIRD